MSASNWRWVNTNAPTPVALTNQSQNGACGNTSALTTLLVSLPSKGVYPRCVECRIQNSPQAYAWGKLQSQFCVEVREQRAWLERRVTAMLEVQEEFAMYGDVLEKMEVFK